MRHITASKGLNKAGVRRMANNLGRNTFRLPPELEVALVGVLGAVIGAGITGFFSWKSGSQIEAQKEKSASELAKADFETRLIFKAVDTTSQEEARRNLIFFLNAGFF